MSKPRVSSPFHTLSGSAASLLVFVSASFKHTTGEIKQQEVCDRTASLGVQFGASSHMLSGYPVVVLGLRKLVFFFLPARDVHRQVNVWMVACLVMHSFCLEVTRSGNNRKYHFRYRITH